jgi:hypothetical protein
MRIRHIIAGLVISMTGLAAHAQTIDDIINKNIDALGGRDKINTIKTMYLESSVDVMGNQAPGITYIVSGKGFKTSVDFNGMQIIQCWTDKGGWSVNPLRGQSKAQVMPADQLKAGLSQLDIGGPLMDYAAKGNKVELTGKENINGATANRISVTTKDNAQLTYFIDSASSLIVRVVSSVFINGQKVESTINFSGYKKTDFGYVFPFSQQMILPQEQQTITLNITNTKVEINKPIDPSVFDMPK